jgi:hypothetical protein
LSRFVSEWGVPNWEEEGGYPKVGELTPRQWWWEFLRRRPDYRNIWAAASPTNEWGYRYAPDVDAFRLEFRLSVVLDPSKHFADWDLAHEFWQVNGGYRPGTSKSASAEALAAEFGLYDFRFHLNQPLTPQLERAKRLLHAIQSELQPDAAIRRPRMDKYPLFLRALDARDAGATFSQIAEVFWPGQEKTPQSARDTHLSACQLRDNFPL